MIKRPLSASFLFLTFIYCYFPLGHEITSGSMIYAYKAAVSIFAIFGIYFILGKKWTAHALASFEVMAVLLQVVTYFTPISQQFPTIVINLFATIKESYIDIPRWLYLAQVAVLLIVGSGGICKTLGVSLKRYISRIRDNRSDSNGLSQMEGMA